VFLLQSTCAPTNDNLMELMIMADAMRRSSASRITAVIPYFGYARQDRRPRSARVADQRQGGGGHARWVGIDRLLTVDLHADQIQGFFQHARGQRLRLAGAGGPCADQLGYEDPIIVSPDIGGVVRARAIAKQANDLELAIIDKRRPQANESRR
jgi:ribose-phosphate pyrophosphokinase